MDGPHAVNAPAGSPAATPLSCPGCGRSLAGPPAVATALFPDATVRRCFGCGSRLLIGQGALQVLLSCQGCGLPFVRGIARTRRCGDCGDAQTSDPLADASVAGATESELRASLASRLRFVRAPRVTAYLERIARSLRRGVRELDGDPRIVLFEDPCPRVLALPSASLLISTGLLRFLADEAELAFVLAHELAHVASGDAATRLVRIGLGAMATSGDRFEEPWAAAAVDVMRLGYGRMREQQADEDALERVVAEGYDPRSILRYLSRLGHAAEQADPELAELLHAHPPPDERRRRAEAALERHAGMGRGAERSNRELYRRAAGPDALSRALEPVDGARAFAPEPLARGPRLGRAVTAIVILATLILVVAWVLA